MAARNPYSEFLFSKSVTTKFDQHRKFFVRRLRCTDFLPYMAKVEGFDQDTRSMIRQKAGVSTPAEANEMFLETLRKSNEQGKWLLFIYWLEKLGYHLLRKILTGELDTAEIEFNERFLEFLTPKIKDKIDPIRLLPYLVRDGYLDKVDKQAIECRCENSGEIAGAELLLNCVQRLKKDVFSGLRTAFTENNMDGVIEEMGRCYDEFLEQSEGDQISDLARSFSRLGLGGSFRRRSSLGSGGLSDEEEALSPLARPRSPTLCEPKDLTLNQYQTELYDAVRDKNTVIICPIKSGKRFVAFRAIKDHLSLARNPDGKVAYIVTSKALVDKVLRRCKVFLDGLPSVQVRTVSSGVSLSKVLQKNNVVIAKAKLFENALSEDVKWTDFSMVILELGVDYYGKRKPVYNQIMESYHELRRSLQPTQRLPQILVLSTSICGKSPLEGLFPTAMETCATFDIEAIALVRKCVSSLRQHVSIPFVERTAKPRKEDRGFDTMISELMSNVERVMKEYYRTHKFPSDDDHSKNRMLELIAPPKDRTSLKYITWQKTNKATLGYAFRKKKCKRAGFFLYCLKLATIYQSALFINTECRRLDALKYMKKKVRKLKEDKDKPGDKDFKGLCDDFYGKTRHLQLMCNPDEDDSTATVVKNRLAQIYKGNPRCKVVLLMKHTEAVLYMKFYLEENLRSVKSACVLVHHQDYAEETEQLFRERFDVLITTWPILAFHLGKEMRTWDYVMRMDCPGNDVITWTRHAETQPISQFAYPETELESPVDLLMESAIEKVTLEIAQQQKDSSGLYRACLDDVLNAASERELWSRSTHSLVSLYKETEGDFFCHGCGTFVCNRAHVRNLDDLWLGLDPGLIHRLSTIRHPEPISFSKGYAKLGRFVCKECGHKWGIVVHVLGKPHLAFAKEGLDYLIDGHFKEYSWKWKYAGINVKQFECNRDLGRCLPSSFCVDGATIAELQKLLPKPSEE